MAGALQCARRENASFFARFFRCLAAHNLEPMLSARKGRVGAPTGRAKCGAIELSMAVTGGVTTIHLNRLVICVDEVRV